MSFYLRWVGKPGDKLHDKIAADCAATAKNNIEADAINLIPDIVKHAIKNVNAVVSVDVTGSKSEYVSGSAWPGNIDFRIEIHSFGEFIPE